VARPRGKAFPLNNVGNVKRLSPHQSCSVSSVHPTGIVFCFFHSLVYDDEEEGAFFPSVPSVPPEIGLDAFGARKNR